MTVSHITKNSQNSFTTVDSAMLLVIRRHRRANWVGIDGV